MKLTKIISVTIGTFILPATAFASFSDVNKNHPYYEDIKDLSADYVVKGYEDGTYKPDNTINRAEFVKIIMEKMSTKYAAEGENCYPDVTTQWYAPYICGATKSGLVSGYPDKKFHPENPITFVEASKVIVNARGDQLDSGNNENWYHKFVKVMESNAAIPFSITAFDKNITRGEMARMISAREWDASTRMTLIYNDLKQLQEKPNSKEKFVYNFNKFYEQKRMNSGYFEHANISANDVPDGIDSGTFKKLDTYLYIDKNAVYQYSISANKLSVIEGADPKTFTASSDLAESFMSDKGNIYIYDKIQGKYVATAIPKRMSKIKGNIFIDGNFVYYFNPRSFIGPVEFIKMDGADPKTFKAYDPYDNEDAASMGRRFFVDKNYAFYHDGFQVVRINNLDMASFELVGRLEDIYSPITILKDKDKVYFLNTSTLKGEEFENADPATFEVLNDETLKDKNAFYALVDGKTSVRHDGIDMATYEDVCYSGEDYSEWCYSNYVKDKNYVYRKEDFKVLQWANPKDFEVKRFQYAYADYEDHSYFIYGSSNGKFWYKNFKTDEEVVMDEIDVDTFEITSGVMDYELKENDEYYYGITAKDKNNIWVYDDKNFELKKK